MSSFYKPPSRPLFITIEGIDGSGKTTLSKNLTRHLKKMRFKVESLRAPGGTQTGDLIRSLIVGNTNLDWSSRAEVLMFMADRAEACEKVIKPALKDGKIVICDRFTGSTIAYQGYGRCDNQKDIAIIEQIESYSRGDVEPDVTLFIDVDPQTALERVSKRRSVDTRFENEGIDYMERVYNGYRNIAKTYDNWHVIDGIQDEDKVLKDCLAVVFASLGIDSSIID